MVEGASLNPMMGWCVVELDLARTKSVRYWPIIKCVAGSLIYRTNRRENGYMSH